MSAVKAEEVTETRLAVVPPMSVENLIAKAIEANISVESLEKLLGMRERLKAEQAKEAFFEALSAFQAACPVIEKKKTVRGEKYSYNYAPLEDIVRTVSPLLREFGLSYRFDTAFEAQPPALVVVCTAYHTQGHSENSTFRTPVDSGARMNVMQQSAAAQTYAKRYAFCNALGILTGDEDTDGRLVPAAGGPQEPSVAQKAADDELIARTQKKHAQGAGAVRAARESAAEIAKETIPELYEEAVRLGTMIKINELVAFNQDPDSIPKDELRRGVIEELDRRCLKAYQHPLDKLNSTYLKAVVTKLGENLEQMASPPPADG